MRCPLNLGDLNKGSADGEASAVGTTANRGHVSPVNKKRVCRFGSGTDDAHEGETQKHSLEDIKSRHFSL